MDAQIRRVRWSIGEEDSTHLFTNMIDYITMASNGNAIEFGELTTVRNNVAAVSTQIRGVFGSGFDSPSTITDTIDYVTIASTGDAVDFGDISIAQREDI